MKKKLTILFLILTFLMLLICTLIFNILTLNQGYEVNRIKTNEKVVMLTFDDGPGLEDGAILDILKHNQIHATFFMTGVNLNRYETEPEIKKVVNRIINEGHAIGNHTYTHGEYLNNVNQLVKELHDNNQMILNIYKSKGINLQEKDIPIRLPYLQYFKGLDWVQNKLDIKYFVRGYLGTDYNEALTGKQEILKQYYSHLSKGKIFVSHTRNYAKEWLPDLINTLKQKSYEFANFRQDSESYYAKYGKLVY